MARFQQQWYKNVTQEQVNQMQMNITRHVQLLDQVKLKIKLKTKNLGNGLTQSMPGENPMQGKKTHTK